MLIRSRENPSNYIVHYVDLFTSKPNRVGRKKEGEKKRKKERKREGDVFAAGNERETETHTETDGQTDS